MNRWHWDGATIKPRQAMTVFVVVPHGNRLVLYRASLLRDSPLFSIAIRVHLNQILDSNLKIRWIALAIVLFRF